MKKIFELIKAFFWWLQYGDVTSPERIDADRHATERKRHSE